MSKILWQRLARQVSSSTRMHQRRRLRETVSRSSSRQSCFNTGFRRRALAVMCAAKRSRLLARLPAEVLCDIIALAASKADARRDDYDDLATVRSGARHLFLPAPGSSGIREALFDAVFGLA